MTPDDIAESLLWFLESNPSDLNAVLEHFPVEVVKECQVAGWLWVQTPHLLFFLTSEGIKRLRSGGRKRKPLPHLAWKHNPHEMTAERAIALFAPPRSPLLTPEGHLVNERTQKPQRYKDIAQPVVKKQDHLPTKTTITRI